MPTVVTVTGETVTAIRSTEARHIDPLDSPFYTLLDRKFPHRPRKNDTAHSHSRSGAPTRSSTARRMGQMRRCAKGDRTLARIYIIYNGPLKKLKILLGTEAIKCYIKEHEESKLTQLQHCARIAGNVCPSAACSAHTWEIARSLSMRSEPCTCACLPHATLSVACA